MAIWKFISGSINRIQMSLFRRHLGAKQRKKVSNFPPEGSPFRQPAAPARRPWRALLLGGCTLAAAACVSTGNKAILDEQVVAQIEPHQATRDQVTSLLGLPQQVSYPEPGGEVWSYYYLVETPRAADYLILGRPWAGGFCVRSRRLSVAFDREGVAQSIESGRQTEPEGSIPY